jgi:hypothetical protein
MVVRNKLYLLEVALTSEADSTTPFCIGCGQWVFDFDEMLASPFVYCIFCDPTIKKMRKRKSKKDIL